MHHRMIRAFSVLLLLVVVACREPGSPDAPPTEDPRLASPESAIIGTWERGERISFEFLPNQRTILVDAGDTVLGEYSWLDSVRIALELPVRTDFSQGVWYGERPMHWSGSKVLDVTLLDDVLVLSSDTFYRAGTPGATAFRQVARSTRLINDELGRLRRYQGDYRLRAESFTSSTEVLRYAPSDSAVRVALLGANASEWRGSISVVGSGECLVVAGSQYEAASLYCDPGIHRGRDVLPKSAFQDLAPLGASDRNGDISDVRTDPPSPPAVAVTGTWTGAIDCGAGRVATILELQQDARGAVTGTLTGSIVNPEGVPVRGAFRVIGRVRGNWLGLEPDGWIERPARNWTAAGISGRIDQNVYEGQVDDDECDGTFILRR